MFHENHPLRMPNLILISSVRPSVPNPSTRNRTSTRPSRRTSMVLVVKGRVGFVEDGNTLGRPQTCEEETKHVGKTRNELKQRAEEGLKIRGHLSLW